MAHPFYTVPEILAVLSEKGFTEKGLNLPSAPGMIEKTILRGHAEMTRNAPRNMLLEDLIVDIPARFDNNQDLVNFRFTFVYNHVTDKMRILGVGSALNEADARALTIVGDSRQLTPASQLYDNLVVIRAGRALDVLRQISPKPSLQKARRLRSPVFSGPVAPVPPLYCSSGCSRKGIMPMHKTWRPS